jgi:asparagine synthetase B (glutamine-hydrolysing)
MLTTDRYGFMPLYYYADAERIVFASEVKAILQVIGAQKLDWESVADFFYIGHMMGERTLFNGIHSVKAGEIITWCHGDITKSTYFDFTQIPVMAVEDVSTEKLASLFMEAVRKRVRRDTQNTLLLSGGADSRLILGALHALQVTPKIITLEHASEKQGLDGEYARRLADALGVECDYRQTRPNYYSTNDWLNVFYILDGMTPCWQLFISEVYPELDSDLGMVWDGLSLDLTLGGSRRIAAGNEENVRRLTFERRIHRLLLGLILSPKHFRAMDQTFMRRLQQEISQVPESENQFVNFLVKHRVRRRIAVNPYQLYDSKVESVTPTSDKDFMDYVLAIPNSLKLNHKIYIEMLRKQFSFLTTIPIISGGVVFDFSSGAKELIKAPAKKRTTVEKIVILLRTVAVNAVKQLRSKHNNRRGPSANHQQPSIIIGVLEQRLFDRQIYNTRLLRRLFASYRNGNMLYHKLFVLVFYIELWHLLFIDEDSPYSSIPRT